MAINVGDVINSATGPASGVISGLIQANQSRLAYERNIDLMNRAAVINERSAQAAYERELEADSTKYQRQVEDLKSAGINPMLAVSSGAGSVSSSPASVSNPSTSPAHMPGFNLGSIFESQQLKLQRALNEAQIRNINAQTDNTEADTAQKESSKRSIDLANEITEATKQARIEAASLSNNLTRKQISMIDKKMDEIDEHMNLMKEQASSEASRRELNFAQAALARANAYQIVQLLPYEKELRQAQSEAQRKAALLSAAHAAYQNKLIDDGYIDAFIAEQKAQQSSAEARATLDQIKTAMRTGDWSNLPGSLGNEPEGSVLSSVMSGLTILLDNLNPLNNVFK